MRRTLTTMFMRAIRGSADSKQLAFLRNAWDHWQTALRDSAEGWLGAEAGYTHKDGFVGTVRFEDDAAARRAEGLPKTSRWWLEIVKYLEQPLVEETTAVDMLLELGDRSAGFLQFILGHTADVARLRDLNEAMEDQLRVHRPDLIASCIGWFDDGRFLKVVHFTSEEEARAGEGHEFPGGLSALFEELWEVAENLTFIDVSQPWILGNEASGAATA